MWDTKKTLIMAWFVGASTTAVLMIGLHVLADGLQETSQVPNLMVYHGTLERDGVGLYADVELTFSLYDGADAADPAWTETQNVSIYGGRFSVFLGSTSDASANALAATVQAADDLYLGVSVLDGDDLVDLANRQRFLPMPYSHWTWAATDLTVNGLDGVGSAGKLSLNTATKGATELAGGLDLYGPEVRFMASDSGDGGPAMVHGAENSLILNQDSQLEGGTLIDSPLVTSPGLVFFKWYDELGLMGMYPTGFSVNEWSCVIGGVRFLDGDLDEDSSDDIMHLNTYRLGGMWWISVDFVSHNNPEEHEVGLLCFQAGITDVESWW